MKISLTCVVVAVFGLVASGAANGAASGAALQNNSATSATASKLRTAKARISLADAKRRIDKAIANPFVMKAIMQHLSSDDQKAFLAEVNSAIKTMPASDAERIVTFVAVNRAALEGSQKGNVATLVAESFATVAPMALPALSESLGSDLMNRSSGGASYSDEQFIKLGQAVMAVVNPRTEQVDHTDVRSGFAALMFVRGSNTPTAEIIDAFASMLPESAQATAKSEWFPAALAEGNAKSYDAMLAAADVELSTAEVLVNEPESAKTQVVEGQQNNEVKTAADNDSKTTAEEVATTQDKLTGDGEKTAETGKGKAVDSDLQSVLSMRVPGPALSQSMLADVAGASTDPTLVASSMNPIYDAVTAPIVYELPNLGNGVGGADVNEAVGEVKKEIENEEPGGYQWQATR